MIAHWPAKIKSARVVNTVASLLDVMPTLSAIAKVPLPTDRVIDGIDISELFLQDHPVDGSALASTKRSVKKSPRRRFFYNGAFTSVDSGEQVLDDLARTIVAVRDGDQ